MFFGVTAPFSKTDFNTKILSVMPKQITTTENRTLKLLYLNFSLFGFD